MNKWKAVAVAVLVAACSSAAMAAEKAAHFEKKPARPAAAIARTGPARVAPDVQLGGGCACGANQFCNGPKGGKFCMTAAGKKRYL